MIKYEIKKDFNFKNFTLFNYFMDFVQYLKNILLILQYIQ
jgi:hypothetical protein